MYSINPGLAGPLVTTTSPSCGDQPHVRCWQGRS